MTTPAERQASLVSGCQAAALVLAKGLNLGDSTNISSTWPVEPGDTILRMSVADRPGDSLVLAINDEVAERLLSDQAGLTSVFNEALAALGREISAELHGMSVERVASSRPEVIAEILDAGQLTALAGATLDLTLGPTTAEAWSPSALSGSGMSPMSGKGSSLSVLNEVVMTVTAELGRTTMPVRDLLNLSPGMVVELDRIAGAPIDLLVNGRRIAAGEVVVIDEEFGVRITEIAPPDEVSR
jgi:flagellar motor switch protein FliN/FliY